MKNSFHSPCPAYWLCVLSGWLFITTTFSSAQVIRSIRASTTEPAITNSDYFHAVLPPSATPRNHLFVFFPGTFPGIPLAYTEILKAASDLGYHAINLAYPNILSVNFNYCFGVRDLPCHETVRREIITGQELSTNVTVTRVDSIEHRLIKLLEYLDSTYPSENWNQFFTSGTNLNWSAMALGGHSQGAGYAGLIAKDVPIQRALLIAGIDWNTSFLNQGPAPWMSASSATPVDRYFGLIHLQDERVPFAFTTNAWSEYGFDVFAPFLFVEMASGSPYTGSHMLTSALGNGITNFHGAMVVDQETPRNGQGLPVYRPVWEYMLAGPTTLDPVRVSTSLFPPATLAIEGYEGYTYTLQGSTNLVAWTDEGPVIIGDNQLQSVPLPDDQPVKAFRFRQDFSGF